MQWITNMFRQSLGFICAIGLLGLPIAGCSDTGGGAAGSGGNGGSGGTGGAGATGGTGGGGGTFDDATIFFETAEFDGTGPGDPLVDVKICEVGTDNCTMSNEEGKAALDFPGNAEVAWTFEKEGYVALAGADVTDETLNPGPFTWALRTEEAMETWAEIMESTYPWAGTFNSALPRREGVTYTLVDGTAKSYYMDDETRLPDPDLTASTLNGNGGFIEVAPGVVEVEFGGTATDCVASLAWTSERPNTIRIPVIEGFTTYGSMRCGEE